ncbi:MAG: ATP-binding cassette domain-containing protein [Lachnospiraceae bacterium]|nr:ATP-binding cassette domain-containing protein [Lachnospiraceae bacterium]
MENSKITITLEGAKKYLTGDPFEYFHIKEGTVYIYIVHVKNAVIGRSLFFCQLDEGSDIPTFSYGNGEKSEFWQFLLVAKDRARISIEEVADKKVSLRESFIEKIAPQLKNVKLDCDSFSEDLASWYKDKLVYEAEVISSINKEIKTVKIGRFNLLGSIFERSRRLDANIEPTGNKIYDITSIYCDYMKMKICPYYTLKSSHGENFTIEDIARASHFVLRKVTLEKKWYTKDIGAMVGSYKESGDPCILIPQGRRHYLLYDLKIKRSIIVDRDLAGTIKAEAYIAYPHLPSKKLRLKDVVLFGIKRVKRTDIFWFVFLYFLTTLVGVLLPMFNEKMYDSLIPMGKLSAIYQVGIAMLACMIGNIFFTIVQNLSSFRAVKTVEYTIVSATYDRIFRLPQKFINSFGTAELLGRINSVSGVFSQTVTAGVSASLGFLLSMFYLWRMFDKSGVLAWRGLWMTIITNLIMFGFGYLRIRRERERLDHSIKANNRLYQYIAGILKIKTSGIENRSLLEYQKENVETLKSEILSKTVSNVGAVVNIFMSMAYSAFIYYLVIKKKQQLSLGEYASFNSAYGMFTSAMGQMAGFFLTWANLLPVMEKVKPIYETEVEITDSSSSIGRLSGSIEVNHMDFAYEDEENNVLKDINFKIEPGEYVGIVGPSGCGKSTLLKCLLGFEKATKGKIFYDNKDIDTMDKVELRRQMGVVLQEGQLVVGNIYTNVTLSSPNLKATEVQELLKEVDLFKDVEDMPMGIFTAISEGGGTVSGGQKQRILIARALANNPCMIFFDEATSALDNLTQAKVCESLEKRNITRVMIAHRLSTVKECDRIFVMDKGQIKEEGNFETLMNKKGLFYQLAKRQEIRV